ncbi:MAG TPA: cold shock domain-containing protein [Methylophilaceae bacterium]|nr:cold shock domain-containing protein [Methylophilaceae bacterium]
MDRARDNGILKTYDPIKGYGFATREKGKDIFVFYADFTEKKSEATAIAGTVIEFDVEITGKGPRARNIVIIS